MGKKKRGRDDAQVIVHPSKKMRTPGQGFPCTSALWEYCTKYKLGTFSFLQLTSHPFTFQCRMDGSVLGTAQDKDKDKALEKAAKMTLHLFDPTGKSAQIDGKPLTLNPTDIAAVPMPPAQSPGGQMGGYGGMPPRGPMAGAMPPPNGYFMPRGMPHGMPPPLMGGGMPPRPPFGMPPPSMMGAPPPFHGGMSPRPPPGMPPGAMPGAPPGFPMQSPTAPPPTLAPPAPAPAPAPAPPAPAALPATAAAGLQFKEEMVSMEERRAELQKYRYRPGRKAASGKGVEQKLQSLDQSIGARLAQYGVQ
jgi:hypothetical protein